MKIFSQYKGKHLPYSKTSVKTVFSSILFIFCFFVLIPITIGFLVSLALRELYKRQLWEKSLADKESDHVIEEAPQENVKLYDSSLDEIESDSPPNTEMDSGQIQNGEPIAAEPSANEPDSELNTEPAFPSAISELPAPPLNPETSEVLSGSEPQSFLDHLLPEARTKPEDSENTLSSVFSNESVLPDTFKIEEILDEMVNEHPPVIPADLSLRIEEDGNSENLLNRMEEENKQDLESDENEILTKIIAPTDSGNQSPLQPEMTLNDFNHEENLESVHSEISPMAVELLGEDFNFDSFFGEKRKAEQKNGESVTVYEIGEGTYQVEGGLVANDSRLLNLLPEEQAVVSLYSEDLIQDVVAEPDLSEAAQHYNFTEELLPMFIRKKHKK